MYMRAGNLQIPFNVTKGSDAAANRIIRGGFMYWDGTTLKKSSAFTWATSDSATRKAITPVFAGVSMVENPVTNLQDFTQSVYSTGVFQLKITSGTYKHGQMVGIAGNGTDAMYDDTVAIVTDPREAIGIIVKNYTSATTSVEVFVYSAYGEFGTLASRMKNFSFYVNSTSYTAAADVLTSYTFGTRVKLVSAQFIVNTATTTANNTFTFKNGANALDDTLVVPTATAVGVVITKAFAGSTNPTREYFDSTTALSIASDGLGDGAGQLIVNYIELPKIQ